jgi:hypothetical protein
MKLYGIPNSQRPREMMKGYICGLSPSVQKWKEIKY